jgi:hypothetical protein
MLEYEQQFSVCEFGYYVPSFATKSGIVHSVTHHVKIENNDIVLRHNNNSNWITLRLECLAFSSTN